MNARSKPARAPSAAATPRRSRLLQLLCVAGLLVAGLLTVRWAVGEYHLRAVQEPLRRRDFVAAEQRLAWCRWARPGDPDVWLLSARTARRALQFERCEEWLEAARRAGARPRRLELERSLLAAQRALTPELEDFLQGQLRKTRTDFPAVAEVLTAEYMRLYRLPAAREVLNRWVELDPSDVEPVVRRAWVAEHQLDFDAALADYRQVLDREPDRDPVRLRVAEILFKIRKIDEAIPELETLMRRDGVDVAVALTLARCRRERAEYDAALAALDRLSAAGAKDPRVKAERGQIALAQGRFAEAERLLREALAGQPREREALYGLQQAVSRQGKTEEAERIDRLLREVDTDGRRMGELIAELAKDPADADLRFEGAAIFLRNGVEEDGVRWLLMTLDADPRHAKAHALLADHYERTGAARQAAVHREAAARFSRPDARRSP